MKYLNITLFKRKHTQGEADHWGYVIPGEAEVKTGPKVFTINPNDKEGMQKLMGEISGNNKQQ